MNHETNGHDAGGGKRDTVCGMTVDPTSAAYSDHDGNRYYFCCAGCKEKFDADPAAYVGK